MSGSLIILVLILLWFQLRQGVFVHLPVELRLRVEAIAVLGGQVLGVQDGVGLPPLSIPVVAVLLEPARLRAGLLGDLVLMRLSIEGIPVALGTDIGRFGSTNPLSGLN